MSKTLDTLDWLRPFHEAANGRTGDALDAAMAVVDDAPDEVRRFALREGLRVALHALRRTSGIRVNGDAQTMPLFVATTEPDGSVLHQMRAAVTVAEIEIQLSRWGSRYAQAGRELSWWTHQRDLAQQANAEPTETLGHIWDRLGVPYEFFIGGEEVAQ